MLRAMFQKTLDLGHSSQGMWASATHTRLSLEMFMGMIGTDVCAWSVLAKLKEMTGLISGVYIVTTMM